MTRLAPSAVLVAALTLVGCGQHPKGNPCLNGGSSCGTLATSLTALNAGRVGGTATGQPTTLAARLAPLAATPGSWLASSILSGPPDEFRIRVKRVYTHGTVDGKDAELPLFQSTDPAGVELTLTSGTMDLAAALGVTVLALPPGHYGEISLEVARVGQVKGCVTGTFRSTAPVSAQMSSTMLSWAPLHGTNVYANDPIVDGLPHTFCTSAALDQVAVPTYSTSPVGSNADFEAVTAPELVEVDLAPGNQDGLSPAALRAASVVLPTAVGFDVTAGATTPLTLGVDLNRVLRYFANTREDLSPPNPAMKAGTSYFFSTTFTWSAVLVAGTAIDFQGYELAVVQHRQGSDYLVPEWLTLALADGAVVSGLVIPDDDDDLTIAKGNLDPAACAETAPGVWTLGFALGPTGQRVSGSFDGFTLGAVGDVTTCGLTPLPGPQSADATYDVTATRRL
jgi:hypothetical protein